MTQTISSEKLYAFLISTPSIVNKAIVTLMYSSALSGAAIRNLKVKHLIDACDEYFRIKEERTVENLLRKDIEIMVPCWQYESSSGVKITFSSPESLFYIFLHLQERFNSGGVDVDDYLFVNSKGNQISKNNITNLFNKSSELDVMFPQKYGFSYKFSSKDLKSNFIFFFKMKLPDKMYAKKSFIDLLSGTVKKNNYWYKESLRNIEPLRMYYRTVLPYLTAKNYEHQYNSYDNFNIELPENKEDEKYPDSKLREILMYYIENNFPNELKMFQKYSYFEQILENGEYNEGDINTTHIKEFEDFKKYGEPHELEIFKKNMENFEFICTYYNDIGVFNLKEFDEYWAHADIKTLFDGYDNKWSIKITKENVKQQMLEIVDILNQLGFFERYELGYPYKENRDMKKQIYFELEEMILSTLRGKSYFYLNLDKIWGMLTGIDLKIKVT